MGAALVNSVSQAMHIMARRDDQSVFSDVTWQQESREAVANVLHGRMAARVAAHLEDCRAQGIADRRNGSYTRHVLTTLGDLELEVPRTRTFNPSGLLAAYARRAPEIDRLILAAFLLGLSTRKVGQTLLRMLGESVSASTVSQVAKQIDAEVKAFHRRRLKDPYRVLMFDGVVLARKSGAGALRRPVLVALGIRPDGRKEVIDFRLAKGESQAAWEAFLNDLYRRGLTGQAARLVVSDGGAGLLAALPLVYPHLPVQRCWAHKVRNVLNKVKKGDRDAVKRDLHRIMNAKGLPGARSAARRFAQRWQDAYPKAVACLRGDLDELLVHLEVFRDAAWRKAARTTNAIERCFVEIRRRTRPMGVMADRASCERIVYAVFTGINQAQGTASPFPLTQNS
jgi:transposase-like protein